MISVKGIIYTTESIPIGVNDVGYIFRIEKQPRKGEDKDWGHAGCILPNGQVVAYGFTPAALVNASSLQGKMEKGLQAKCRFDYQLPAKYTVVETAINSDYESQVLIITTDSFTASQFRRYWINEPGSYNKIFRNCSSVCYQAFLKSNLIKQAWLPIITPRRLYDLLLETCQSRRYKYIEKIGFVGIEPASESCNKLIIAKRK